MSSSLDESKNSATTKSKNSATNTLDKHKVPTKYVRLIKDMYNNVVTRVRTSDGDTDDFPIMIGLHQGSALSPYLFALVMDEVYAFRGRYSAS